MDWYTLSTVCKTLGFVEDTTGAIPYLSIYLPDPSNVKDGSVMWMIAPCGEDYISFHLTPEEPDSRSKPFLEFYNLKRDKKVILELLKVIVAFSGPSE